MFEHEYCLSLDIVLPDLLKRCRIDLRNIMILKSNPDIMVSDDLESAAYHIQQATEKMLKYLVIDNRLMYPNTHNIGSLCDILDANTISYPAWVRTYSGTLTSWETTTRYGKVITKSAKVIWELYDKCLELMSTLIQPFTQIPRNSTETQEFRPPLNPYK